MMILKNVISEFFFHSLSKKKFEEPTFSTKDLVQDNSFLADPLSRSSDPKLDWSGLLTGGYKVKIRRSIKKITLLRFLTAKLIYDEDGLHLDEFIILFELYYDLIGQTDPSFSEKYGDWFSNTLNFYEVIAKGKSFPLRISKESKKDEIQQWLEPILPSKSAYFGLKGQRNMRDSFSITLNTSLPPVRIPPKSYIGVGYRDKGTHKNFAKDGSPSWQEVSSHNFELERRKEEISNDPGVLPDLPLLV